MRLEAEVDGATHTVQVEGGDGARSVVLDGRRIEVDARPLEGLFFFSVLIEGKVYEVTIEPDGDALRVQVGTVVHRVAMLDPLRPARDGAGTEGSRRSGPIKLCALMPGRVSRVLMKAGDDVAQGQEVLFVEAMKMENAISSPAAGRILEIHVVPGDAVEAGATLAVIG